MKLSDVLEIFAGFLMIRINDLIQLGGRKNRSSAGILGGCSQNPSVVFPVSVGFPPS
jgi:hypothetical protein